MQCCNVDLCSAMQNGRLIIIGGRVWISQKKQSVLIQRIKACSMDVPNFNTPLTVLKFVRVRLTHKVCLWKRVLYFRCVQ